MTRLVQKLVFILTLSLAVSTTVKATNVYYTFSPFFSLQGIGLILETDHIYGNLDIKGGYERHIQDAYRPQPEDHFFWNYAFNVGGGYRYRGILIGADIGYLNKTKSYINQFENATSNSGHLLYGVNLGFKLHHLFLGVRYGNIELLSFKVGISF